MTQLRFHSLFFISVFFISNLVTLIQSETISQNENASTLPKFYSPNNSKNSKHEVEKFYENMKIKINYDTCWKTALNILHAGCENMDDFEQRKIAYFFMICHLEASGRGLAPEETCSEMAPSKSENFETLASHEQKTAVENFENSENSGSKTENPHNLLKSCLQKLTPSNFQIYTEFFTHTHDLCHHLQQAFWIQATENTINKLTSQSDDLTQKLLDSSTLALKTLEIQKSIESYSEKLVDNEKMYQSSFDELKNWIQSDIVSKFSDDLFKVYDMIYKNSEFLNKIIFYFIGMIVIFIITSVNAAVKNCRFFCLMILFCCLSLEYYLFNSNFEADLLKIYYLRKITAGLMLMNLVYHQFSYKNYNRLHSKKLSELQNELTFLRSNMALVLKNVKMIQKRTQKRT